MNKQCYIIAEAGVNHNGSLERAKELVDAAKDAGANAVKFQTFKSENLVNKDLEIAEYQERNIGKKESQMEMLKKLELDYNDFVELKKHCDGKNIVFLSTPHSEDAIDFLEPLVPMYKIGAGDLTNLPFLEKIAKKNKPIILSTGMADLKEVGEAVETIKKAGNIDITLLHCTTNYPCPLEEVNLKAMNTLKERFGLAIGYSDHTLGITVPIMAAALGAQVLEKHFTINKELPGPDHKASLNPEELKEMVKLVRETEKALGSGIKAPFKSEEKIKRIIRKSIVAKKDIKADTVIKEDMIEIKRPAGGILPKYFKEIIGKKVKKDIKKGELVTWKMI